MLNPPFLSVGKTTIVVTRKTPGTYVKGVYQEGTPTTKTIIANIQPGLRLNDTQHLPEGERGRLALRIYTSSELRARREGSGGHDADEFIYNGETYVVKWSQYYDMGVLSHTKAIAVAKEVT